MKTNTTNQWYLRLLVFLLAWLILPALIVLACCPPIPCSLKRLCCWSDCCVPRPVHTPGIGPGLTPGKGEECREAWLPPAPGGDVGILPFPPSPGGGAGGCPTCAGGEGGAGGPRLTMNAARVRVVETPLWFDTARGPSFVFRLSYDHRDTRLRADDIWHTGYKWSSAYGAYAQKDGSTLYVHLCGEKPLKFLPDGAGGYQEAVNACGCEPVGYHALAADGGGGLTVRLRGGGAYGFEPWMGNANRWRLAAIRDRLGDELRLYYDAGNAVTSAVTAAGNAFAFSYSPSGLLTNLHDATGGRDARFAYSGDLLTEVTDMGGQRFGFGYDAGGNLTALSRPKDGGTAVTAIEYAVLPECGLQVTFTHPEGGVERNQWKLDGSWRMLEVNGLGGVTTNIPDLNYSFGDPFVEEVDPLGRVTSYLYWDGTGHAAVDGRLKKRVAPDDTSVAYTYNAFGDLTGAVHRDATQGLVRVETNLYAYFPGTWQPQTIQSETRDAAGAVLAKTLTAYERDERGTTNRWDDVYLFGSRKDWWGQGSNDFQEVRAAYGTNFLFSQTLVLAGPGTNDWRLTRGYDLSLSLTDTVDPLGRLTSHFYDTAGRQYMTVYPDGTLSSNTYDSAGRTIQTARYTSFPSTFPASSGGEASPLLGRAPSTFTLYTYDALGRQTVVTDALGNATSNRFDMLSRTVRVTAPDGTYSRTEFDRLGNAVLHIGPVAGSGEEASATVSNRYDALDRLVETTDPLGRTATTLYDPDRPALVIAVLNDNGAVVQTNVYDDLTDRLVTNVVYGVRTAYEYDAAGQAIKVTYPDGTFSTNRYDGPRLVAQTSRTGHTTTFAYDAVGRRVAVTNAAGAVTRWTYNAAGETSATVDPLTNITSFVYDDMGRQTRVTRPDGSVTTNSYDSLGRLTARTGAGAVPVFYRYDAIGRVTNLVDGESNVTRFQYDSMGRLVKKTYADNSFYAYGYSPRGWLTNRVDGLGRTTRYGYDNAGQLTTVDYPTDSDVSHFYDNLGRQTSRVDAAGTWTWTYSGESPRLASEALLPSTPNLPPSTVSYSYHSNTYDLARVALDATNYTEYAWHAGRLTNVTSDAGSFAYTYEPDSDLVGLLTTDHGLLTVSRTYDSSDRLLSVSNTWSDGGNAFDYTLDNLGRRTGRTDSEKVGSPWSVVGSLSWGYDKYDQLTLAARTNGPNGAADLAYRFGYQYDRIGNRFREDRGPAGDPLGRQFHLDGTFNPLNQLTALDWSGKYNIVGAIATTNAYVLVQGITNAPPFYHLATNPPPPGPGVASWLGGATLGPGSNLIPIVAWEGTNSTEMNRTVFMPPTKPQDFQYDLNGNLTNDSLRVYAWDEENRLSAIETLPGIPGLPRRRSEYAYDAQGRRAQTTDYQWSAISSQWSVVRSFRYVWDGWLLLAETAGDGAVTAYDTHGLDLSGSLQGAGGIGGLLARAESGSNYLYTFDGNGNVTDVIGTNGTVVAHYEYDPFGRTVAQSGPYAAANPWRFSTKQYEGAWGLYYYGHRLYSPQMGRWLSRDPAAERGGKNLFAYLLNSPNLRLEFLGLWSLLPCCNRASYIPVLTCCCCGGHVKWSGNGGCKKVKRFPLRKTGVRICSFPAGDPFAHRWLEIGEGEGEEAWSAGLYPSGADDGSAGWLKNPDPGSYQKKKHCEEVEESPCNFNFETFREAIKAKVAADKPLCAGPPSGSAMCPYTYSWWGFNCISYIQTMLSNAEGMSRGCTVP